MTSAVKGLTQLWFKTSCRYRQHEVLTRDEWILASTAALAQYLTDIGSVSACTRRQQYALSDSQPRKHKALNQCCFDAEPASHGEPVLDQHWVNVSFLLGVLTGHIVFCTSPGVEILKLLPN